MVAPKKDRLSNTQIGISYPHSKVHRGDLYQVTVSSTDLANDKWLSLATPAAVAAQWHITFSAALDGTAKVEFIEDATYATAGTTTGTATAYNMHRGKDDYAVAMIANSSSVSGGTTIMGILLPGGRVGQSDGVAGETRQGLEWITNPAKKYLVRVINKAGAAKAASLEVNFYIREE